MMATKLIFFFFFCVFLSGASAGLLEQSFRVWVQQIRVDIQEVENECDFIITEGRLIEIEEELQLTRADIIRLMGCIVMNSEYMTGGTINVARMMQDIQARTPGMSTSNIDLMNNILTTCAEEAQRSSNGLQMAEQFAGCAMGRLRNL